jgi:DNA-binding GntR family transcriptional regulator
MDLDGIGKPQALKDWAYSTLKQDILSGKYAVGQQLPVEELAERMNISRTPVREALLMLEHEGLISAASRVGFFVKRVEKVEMQELFELRELMEGYAAEKACKHLSEKDLAEMEKIIGDGQEAFERNDLEAFLEAEIKLHSSIQELAQNKYLLRMSKSLKDLTHRERVLSLASKENMKESLREHEKIVAALRQRDGELAARMMREHLGNVKTRMLALLDQMEEHRK